MRANHIPTTCIHYLPNDTDTTRATSRQANAILLPNQADSNLVSTCQSIPASTPPSLTATTNQSQCQPSAQQIPTTIQIHSGSITASYSTTDGHTSSGSSLHTETRSGSKVATLDQSDYRSNSITQRNVQLLSDALQGNPSNTGAYTHFQNPTPTGCNPQVAITNQREFLDTKAVSTGLQTSAETQTPAFISSYIPGFFSPPRSVLDEICNFQPTSAPNAVSISFPLPDTSNLQNILGAEQKKSTQSTSTAISVEQTPDALFWEIMKDQERPTDISKTTQQIESNEEIFTFLGRESNINEDETILQRFTQSQPICSTEDAPPISYSEEERRQHAEFQLKLQGRKGIDNAKKLTLLESSSSCKSTYKLARSHSHSDSESDDASPLKKIRTSNKSGCVGSMPIYKGNDGCEVRSMEEGQTANKGHHFTDRVGHIHNEVCSPTLKDPRPAEASQSNVNEPDSAVNDRRPTGDYRRLAVGRQAGCFFSKKNISTPHDVTGARPKVKNLKKRKNEKLKSSGDTEVPMDVNPHRKSSSVDAIPTYRGTQPNALPNTSIIIDASEIDSSLKDAANNILQGRATTQAGDNLREFADGSQQNFPSITLDADSSPEIVFENITTDQPTNRHSSPKQIESNLTKSPNELATVNLANAMIPLSVEQINKQLQNLETGSVSIMSPLRDNPSILEGLRPPLNKQKSESSTASSSSNRTSYSSIHHPRTCPIVEVIQPYLSYDRLQNPVARELARSCSPPNVFTSLSSKSLSHIIPKVCQDSTSSPSSSFEEQSSSQKPTPEYSSNLNITSAVSLNPLSGAQSPHNISSYEDKCRGSPPSYEQAILHCRSQSLPESNTGLYQYFRHSRESLFHPVSSTRSIHSVNQNEIGASIQSGRQYPSESLSSASFSIRRERKNTSSSSSSEDCTRL